MYCHYGYHIKEIISNYRLVSLTSICCKALEHIIYSHILRHLQTHGILCEEQRGFQSGKCCDSMLIITTSDFVNCLNENKQIDAIFLTFLKHLIKYPTKDCLINYLIMELEVLCWYG